MMSDEQFERYAPMATMADAHREWHTNTGIPMGTPGCPQDACHLPDDMEEEQPQFRCGNHGWNAHVYHYSVEDVKRCFASGSKAPAKAAAPAPKPCCDGTGWTGNPKAPCAVHYQPQNFGGFATPIEMAATGHGITQEDLEGLRINDQEPKVVKVAKPDRVPVEEIQSWRSIPVTNHDHAFYALRSAVDGTVTCFRVKRPSTGPYKGRTYVDRQSGDNFVGMPFRETAQVLSAIVKDPAAAAVLYGKTIKRCALCHRSLSDDKNKGPDGLTSTERGIGPKCAKKVGMV